MTDTKRQWKNDSIMINARDAQQMVSANRSAFTLNRAKNLVVNALNHGHSQECQTVFQDALDNLNW